MKKAIIIVLAVIVVLLPTIAALVLHFMPDSSITNPINISGHFSDGASTQFEFNRSTNTSLASFFDQLHENSYSTDLVADRLVYDKSYKVDMVKRNVTTQITLYLSVNRSCYFNDNGTIFQINTDYANTLLNSKYAASLYEELYTPHLITHSKDTVTPSSTQFKYVMKGGDFIERNNTNVTGDMLTYYSSNTSLFTFSADPTYGTITAYYDGTSNSWPLYEFDPDALPKNALIKFEIDATWVKKPTSNVMGSAKYEFYIDYSPAPTFTVDKKEAIAGDFIVVTASNILDPGKISCTFSGGQKTDPQFFKNGDSYVALIPLDMDMKASYYRLTLECGETKKVWNVNVKSRDKSSSSNVYETSSPLTEEMLADMNSLISSIGLRSSQEIFASGAFVNYDATLSEELQLMLNYGRTREFSTGLPFRMVGVEYLSFDKVDVPVINSGIVCAIGTDAVLGNYIVVDHGYGLKSWYCNVESITLSVGDTVAKGDKVATTGSSAFYGKNGVYLITTVLDVPVYPYALIDHNFELPN